MWCKQTRLEQADRQLARAQEESGSKRSIIRSLFLTSLRRAAMQPQEHPAKQHPLTLNLPSRALLLMLAMSTFQTFKSTLVGNAHTALAC